jgi:hypothetical protein
MKGCLERPYLRIEMRDASVRKEFFGYGLLVRVLKWLNFFRHLCALLPLYLR